jgi:hypothetical protein
MNEGWTSTETLSVSYITVRVHADYKLYRLRRRVQLVAGWANGDTIIDGAKFKLLLRACECPSSVQFIVNQGSTIERSRFSKN